MNNKLRHAKRGRGNAAEKAFVLFAEKRFKVVRNGWPDYFVQDLKTRKFLGVEVKQGANVISSEQQVMFAALERAGFTTAVWNPNRPQRLAPWRTYKKDPSHALEPFLARLADSLSSTRLEAVIVESMACLLNGALVHAYGVTLLVRDTKCSRKKLRQLAEELGGVGPERFSSLTSTGQIYGADLPIDILYDKMAGDLSFASVKSRARPHVVGNKGQLLLVAALADIITSKTAANRPKDRAVLPILCDTLAARRAAGREEPEAK